MSSRVSSGSFGRSRVPADVGRLDAGARRSGAGRTARCRRRARRSRAAARPGTACELGSRERHSRLREQIAELRVAAAVALALEQRAEARQHQVLPPDRRDAGRAPRRSGSSTARPHARSRARIAVDQLAADELPGVLLPRPGARAARAERLRAAPGSPSSATVRRRTPPACRRRQVLAGRTSIPSHPIDVETMALPIAIASSTFSRVPPPTRSGTT